MDCPRCGRPSPDDARFCSQCGAPLIPDASNAANPPEEPASTEEFKPVTILFVDIVASTELVSNLDAEQAMRRLAPALAVMRRVAEQFGGTVIHTLGDGIMALFGAPRDSGRACIAGLPGRPGNSIGARAGAGPKGHPPRSAFRDDRLRDEVLRIGQRKRGLRSRDPYRKSNAGPCRAGSDLSQRSLLSSRRALLHRQARRSLSHTRHFP